MRVFCLHGMGRSSPSLWLLRARLKSAGHVTHGFDYFVALQSWTTIVDRFVGAVSKSVTSGEPYAIVGHSLGNIIARAASPRLPAGLRAIAMMAPPNQSPLLARKFKFLPFFKLVTGDAGQNLAAPDFYANLPIPAVPTLVLAGTRGPRARWLPHGLEPGDGVVSVSETRLAGAEHLEVPCLHTLIMNDPEVARSIVGFFEKAR